MKELKEALLSEVTRLKEIANNLHTTNSLRATEIARTADRIKFLIENMPDETR